MTTTDKKDYRAVLACLIAAGTVTGTSAKLAKIFAHTEDEKMKRALGSLLRELGTAKGKHRPLGTLPKFEPLVKYCEAMIKSGKPLWQILAEQNGWAPKP